MWSVPLPDDVGAGLLDADAQLLPKVTSPTYAEISKSMTTLLKLSDMWSVPLPDDVGAGLLEAGAG